MRAGQSLPPVLWPVTVLVCLAFGGLALLLGMDASWDLRNHHFYNGWAFLNGVVGKDPLVSQIPSFFNPTLDAAYVALAQSLPAWAVGFLLGMVHGLNFPLLFAIGWRMLEVRNPHRRALAAGALALAGVTGAGGLSLVGTAFHESIVSLGVLAAVALVVTWWEELADGGLPGAAVLAIAAGVPAGLGFGLKLPTIVLCIGLSLAFLMANIPLVRRLWLTVWFGIGVLVGLGVGGGHWMAYLWQTYGNPLFPFLNHIFLSPWGAASSYHDPGFLQPGLVDMITFGWRFPFDPLLAGEIEFRDYRILAVITLLPLAALASLLKRDRDPGVITTPGPTGWLLAAAATTYVAWVALLCIYRYLVPLEMLAPLVVVAAIGCLPLPRAARRGLSTARVAFLAATTLPGDWLRVPWEDKAVSASVPAVKDPDRTLVLLSGHEPLSFLIPLFPGAEHMRFLRIDSTFTLADDPGAGFRRLFRDTIDAAPGPIYSLHIVTQEQRDVVHKLAEYGLELDTGSCLPITSPIGADVYRFCLTRRPGASAPAEEAMPTEPPADGSAGSAGSPAEQ
ncbi:MAG: hypothetical protein AB1918_06965 [Pseudomonadota bacterium]